MIKLFSFLTITAILFTSCKKDDTSGSTQVSSSFQAKINGQVVNFNVASATLIRSTSTNQKRVDIQGISTDGTARLIITLGENVSTGNAISVKKYIIRLFNDDNPSTTVDESDDSDDGFFTYSTKVGSNWVTEVYSENGEVAVSACNAGSTTISGTFKSTAVNLNGGAGLTITEGKFEVIKYIVAN